MLPRDVECPHCHAKVGHGCHSSKQPLFSVKTHVARWRAVGVTKPTFAQRYADSTDGQARDDKFREEFFRELRAQALTASSSLSGEKT